MTTYSQNIGLSEPTPGDPAVANVWGTILNTNQGLVDSAVAGLLTLSVAGAANVVLTSTNGAADQSRNAAFNFTGALTGNINVLWPNGKSRVFIVTNGTSGAYTLTCAVSNGSGGAAGTAFVVLQGETVMLTSDGTNVALANTPKGSGGISGSGLTPSGIALSATATSIKTTAVMTNGELLVGQTGADPLPKAVSGAASSMYFSIRFQSSSGISGLSGYTPVAFKISPSGLLA